MNDHWGAEIPGDGGKRKKWESPEMKRPLPRELQQQRASNRAFHVWRPSPTRSQIYYRSSLAVQPETAISVQGRTARAHREIGLPVTGGTNTTGERL
jgi:hypothetical protein